MRVAEHAGLRACRSSTAGLGVVAPAATTTAARMTALSNPLCPPPIRRAAYRYPRAQARAAPPGVPGFQGRGWHRRAAPAQTLLAAAARGPELRRSAARHRGTSRAVLLRLQNDPDDDARLAAAPPRRRTPLNLRNVAADGMSGRPRSTAALRSETSGVFGAQTSGAVRSTAVPDTDQQPHRSNAEVQRRYGRHLSGAAHEAAVAAAAWALAAATVLASRHGAGVWVGSLLASSALFVAYPLLGQPAPKSPRGMPAAAKMAAAVVAGAGFAMVLWAQGAAAVAGSAVAAAQALMVTLLAYGRIWPPDELAYGIPWSEAWHSPTERRRAFEEAAIAAFNALRSIRAPLDEQQASRLARIAAEQALCVGGDRIDGEPRRLAVFAASASAVEAWRSGCSSWWDHEGAPAA